MVSVVSQFSADVLDAIHSEERNRSISKRRHNLRPRVFSNTARVFSKGCIAYVMRFVLYAPVATSPLQEFRRTSKVAWHTRDEITSGLCLLTSFVDSCLDLTNLGDPRPVQVLIEYCRCGQRSNFPPTVAFIYRLRRLKGVL